MNGTPEHTMGAITAGSPGAADHCVERSWQRSSKTLASDQRVDLVNLSPGELDEHVGMCEPLIAAAHANIADLARSVGRASGIVLLADHHGVILQVAGCDDFLHRAQKYALQAGVSWAESVRGTNAIGTSIVEGRPVRIHGIEHFLDCNKALSCHAVPIRSSQGALIGVLNISNDASRFHPHALTLAQGHARQISNRMIAQAARGRLCLELYGGEAPPQEDERGLILIEDGCLVGANEIATELLQTSWKHLIGRPASELLDGWASVAAEPTLLMGIGGREVRASRLSGQASADTKSAPWQSSPKSGSSPKTGPTTTPRPSTVPLLAPDVDDRVSRAALAINADLSVMLLGETGTGKEVCARHLHARSRWAAGPIVAVNCAAIPESLIEAELFGYAHGAFTGARRGGMNGRMREANGGVLFLDEIGDMSPSAQVRLLRALQERAIQPLGSDRLVPISFGLVCATNRDLHRLVNEGYFRADLFYRLHDYTLTLPALRSRPDLRDFIRSEFTRLSELSPAPSLGNDALDVLVHHRWPGNYRELQAILRVLALFAPAGGLVRAAHIPEDILLAASIDQGASTAGSSAALPRVRKAPLTHESLVCALQHTEGNITRAAARLGIHRSTFYRRMAHEGLDQMAVGGAVGA